MYHLTICKSILSMPIYYLSIYLSCIYHISITIIYLCFIYLCISTCNYFHLPVIGCKAQLGEILPSGNTQRCLGTFLVVTPWGREEDSPDMWWEVETRDAVQRPQHPGLPDMAQTQTRCPAVSLCSDTHPPSLTTCPSPSLSPPFHLYTSNQW